MAFSLQEFLIILGVAATVAGFLGTVAGKREVKAHEDAVEDKWESVQKTVGELTRIQVASLRANYAASDSFADAMDAYYPDIVEEQIKPIKRNGHRNK